MCNIITPTGTTEGQQRMEFFPEMKSKQSFTMDCLFGLEEESKVMNNIICLIFLVGLGYEDWVQRRLG